MPVSTFTFESEGSENVISDLNKMQAAFGKSTQEVLGLGKTLGLTFQEARKLAAGLGLPADQAEKAARMLLQLTNAGANTQTRFNQLNQELGVTSAQFLKLEKTISLLNNEINKIQPEPIRKLGNNVDETSNKVKTLKERFDDLGKGIQQGIGQAIFLQAQQGLQNFTGSVIDAGVRLDTLNQTLKFASGGSSAAAKDLGFVNEVVDRLSLSLPTAVSGFTQLTASTRGTELAGAATREIFEGLSLALSSTGANAETTKRAFNAVQQIASKGKVSLEEVSQQLAEALPGSVAISSRALGITQAEFIKLVSTGDLLAKDFLPKFAKQLKTEFPGAVDTAQASLNELTTAQTRFNEALGTTVLPAFIATLEALSKTLDFARTKAVEFGKLGLVVLTASVAALAFAFKAQLIPAINILIFTALPRLAVALALTAAPILPYVLAIGALTAGFFALEAASKAAIGAFAGVTEAELAAGEAAAKLGDDFLAALKTLASGQRLADGEIQKLTKSILDQAAAGTLVKGNLEDNDRAAQIMIRQLIKLRDATNADIAATDAQVAAKTKLTESLKTTAQAYSDSNQTIADSFATAKETIAGELEAGLITEADARARGLEAETKYYNDRIALNQARLIELRTLQSNSLIDPKEAARLAKEIDKIERDSTNNRLKLLGVVEKARKAEAAEEKKLRDVAKKAAEDARKEQERVYQQGFDDLKAFNERIAQQINQATAERIALIKQQRSEGVITEQEASEEILEIVASANAQEIELATKRLAQLVDLRKKGVLSAKQFTQEERDIQRELSALNIAAIDVEIKARDNAKARQIKNIQDVAAQQKNASLASVAGIESEKEALDDLVQANDTLKKLLESRNNLQSALATLDQTKTQIELDNIARIQEIRTTLNSGEVLSLKERLLLVQELGRLGVADGTTDLQILQARFDAETRLAAQKAIALDNEAAAALRALDLEGKRNALLARRAVLEAKIAQQRAVSDLGSANTALSEAILEGDEQLVANARTSVDLAEQSLGFAKQNVTEAESQIVAQVELQKNARDTLVIQNAAAIAQNNAANDARLQAQSLALARAESKQLATNLSAAASSSNEVATIAPSLSTNANSEFTKNAFSNFPKLFSGGQASAGQPVIVGDGPGGKILPTSEVIVPSTSSYVVAAAKLREILAGSANRALLPTGSGTPTSGQRMANEIRALRGDVRGLRKDMATRTLGDTFNISGVEDPVRESIRAGQMKLRNQARGGGF